MKRAASFTKPTTEQIYRAIFVNTLVYCYDEEAEENPQTHTLTHSLWNSAENRNETWKNEWTWVCVREEKIVKCEKAIESESNWAIKKATKQEKNETDRRGTGNGQRERRNNKMEWVIGQQQQQQRLSNQILNNKSNHLIGTIFFISSLLRRHRHRQAERNVYKKESICNVRPVVISSFL